jgi:hypothetical protein
MAGPTSFYAFQGKSVVPTPTPLLLTDACHPAPGTDALNITQALLARPPIRPGGGVNGFGDFCSTTIAGTTVVAPFGMRQATRSAAGPKPRTSMHTKKSQLAHFIHTGIIVE